MIKGKKIIQGENMKINMDFITQRDEFICDVYLGINEEKIF